MIEQVELHNFKSHRSTQLNFDDSRLHALDNQPERRQHLDQARSEYTGQPKLEIVIGTADRMREAWFLNGFMPLNPKEERILKEITTELTFDPCIEAHRLRSNLSDERNPKVVVEKLTDSNSSREQQC